MNKFDMRPTVQIHLLCFGKFMYEFYILVNVWSSYVNGNARELILIAICRVENCKDRQQVN